LHSAMIEEGFLDLVEMLVLRHSLYRQDLSPLGLRGEHQAGVDRFAVEQNGAGAALAGFAAALHAEIAFAPQYVQQDFAGRDVPESGLAVHGQPQFHSLHNEHPALAAHSSSARPVRTRLSSRRYSADARTSPMGCTSRITEAQTSASRPWSIARPAINASALGIRTGNGATDPKAIRAHLTCLWESSCKPAATLTTEISTAVRPNFTNDQPECVPAVGTANVISTSREFASARLRATARYSASGIFRLLWPLAPTSASTAVASSASSGVARSAAGEPFAMFPPTVAMLRTCTDPHVAAARASKPPARLRISAESSRSAMVLAAPMLQQAPRLRT